MTWADLTPLVQVGLWLGLGFFVAAIVLGLIAAHRERQASVEPWATIRKRLEGQDEQHRRIGGW